MEMLQKLRLTKLVCHYTKDMTKPPIPKEIQQAVQKEILAVLKKNGMPTPMGIQEAVKSLMKEVSCAQQNGA